jgi:hypothetical protein
MPTFTERRLNDRYANSHRTFAWRQLNAANAPKAGAMQHRLPRSRAITANRGCTSHGNAIIRRFVRTRFARGDSTDLAAMVAYDAFVSYSHAHDKPLAAALQSAMQRLGKAWYRRRALRLFRDDTSLSATPELWRSIEQALGQSRFLILIASPEAAGSPWVDKEVAHWLYHNGAHTLLIALTDGELAWDGAAGDFRWSEAIPLPPTLKGRFAVEPFWIDVRAYRNVASPRDAKFVDLAANFAATIHGVPKEDLLSQEVRQQRRALRLAWSAVGTLIVLLALAGWQWRVAENAKQAALAAQRKATEQQKIAEVQRDRAERTLAFATQTANGLIFELAQKFRDAGIPAALRRLPTSWSALASCRISSLRAAKPRPIYVAARPLP